MTSNLAQPTLTPEEARALYTNCPSMWPTLAPELSTDRHRRAAQLAYPATPQIWSEADAPRSPSPIVGSASLSLIGKFLTYFDRREGSRCHGSNRPPPSQW